MELWDDKIMILWEYETMAFGDYYIKLLIRLQDYETMGLNYGITGLCDYKVIRSWNYRIMECGITEYRITGLWDYGIT